MEMIKYKFHDENQNKKQKKAYLNVKLRPLFWTHPTHLWCNMLHT